MNKTDDTILAYLNRGSQLWMRAAKAVGIDTAHLPPTRFVAWVQALMPELKPASRRQYLAAIRQLLMYMQETPTSYKFSAEDLKLALAESKSMHSSHYTKVGLNVKPWRGQTSSQKSKKISTAELSCLTKKARSTKGCWTKPALLWMTANIIVGLRPSEWRSAHLSQQEEKIILVIQNAKYSNGRANGEKRHIELTGLRAVEKKLIQLQLDAVKQYAASDVDWNKYYTGVRKAIHRMTRAVFPNQRKYPSLYSSRHQFAANAKSAGMSKVEVAALMGHAIDETAGCHYGKKKHGSGACRVKPSIDEVLHVRITSTLDVHKLVKVKAR